MKTLSRPTKGIIITMCGSNKGSSHHSVCHRDDDKVIIAKKEEKELSKAV